MPRLKKRCPCGSGRRYDKCCGKLDDYDPDCAVCRALAEGGGRLRLHRVIFDVEDRDEVVRRMAARPDLFTYQLGSWAYVIHHQITETGEVNGFSAYPITLSDADMTLHTTLPDTIDNMIEVLTDVLGVELCAVQELREVSSMPMSFR